MFAFANFASIVIRFFLFSTVIDVIMIQVINVSLGPVLFIILTMLICLDFYASIKFFLYF